VNSPRPEAADFLARSEQHRRARSLRRFAWILISTLLLLTLLAAVWVGPAWYKYPMAIESAQADYIWVQMLPDSESAGGGRLARAIVSKGDQCPSVVENGRILEMRKHVARVRAAFPILVCERELASESEAHIGSHSLPIRPADPDTILVIGDTGCRIVHYQDAQPCFDGIQWPFEQIAKSAAAELAQRQTQPIIIHVGDFHYREKPCSDGDQSCGGTPFGDNWETWRAEFFEPVKPLLLAAPWVILRGNHENCERAGSGWLFFFALPHQAFNGVCEEDRPPYELKIGQTHGADRHPRTLLVLDTADAANRYVKKHYEAYCTWVPEKTDPSNSTEKWLVLHQPLWFISREEDDRGREVREDKEKPEELEVRKDRQETDKSKDANNKPKLPRCVEVKDKQFAPTSSAINVIRTRLLDSPPAEPRFSVILSGDTHLFQVFRPEDSNLGVQIVAGNGGTALEDEEHFSSTRVDRTIRASDAQVPDRIIPPGRVTAIRKHGFVILHENGESWTANLYDIAGKRITSCEILGLADHSASAGNSGACEPP
jgi:hypothetical protein